MIGVGVAAGFALPVGVPVAGVEFVLVGTPVEVAPFPAAFVPPVVPGCALPVAPVESAAGVEDGVVGIEVSGVGTSGMGLVKIPAIISLRPAADLLRSV